MFYIHNIFFHWFINNNLFISFLCPFCKFNTGSPIKCSGIYKTLVYLTAYDFIIKVLLCCVIPNLFFLLVYGKTSEFRYFLTLGKSVLGKRMHKSA